ncbi:MAG: methyltransferase domain-containing protein, partial [Candidatus Marinimicrobia bacterium]|nr:methyltransferase domain-containing protein [Candidatus Neomarinimicrobiota bacterium]
MTNNRQEKERHFWDAFANRYDSFMKYLKPAYTILIEYIKEELKPNFVILEVATGTGIIALEMATDVKKVYGIDISPEMINIATEKAF